MYERQGNDPWLRAAHLLCKAIKEGSRGEGRGKKQERQEVREGDGEENGEQRRCCGETFRRPGGANGEELNLANGVLANI